MPVTGIAYPEQLTALTSALDHYCRAQCIQPFTPEHEDVAWLIMQLFLDGVILTGEIERGAEDPGRHIRAPWGGFQTL